MLLIGVFTLQLLAKWAGNIMRNSHQNFMRNTLLALLLFAVTSQVFAQWSYEDIGSPAMAGNTMANGTFTSFTQEGGGGSVGGTSDQGHFAHRQQTGNFEFTAKLGSLENTSSNARAGIMVRQDPGLSDIAADGPFVLVSVAAGGGARFSYRTTAAETATNVDVPAITAPVWLRLSKAGGNFTGYYSSDGNVWTQIAQQSVPGIGSVSVVGLAVSSANPAQLCSAEFTNVTVASHVPVAGGNLRLWLRADTGVTTTTGSTVTTWLDQSGQGNNATQATAGFRPVLVPNILGEKPVVRFNATATNYLGVANHTSLALDRVSVYAVVKRTSGTAAAVVLEQFTANTAGYSLQTSTGVARAFRINGTVSTYSVPSPGQSFNVLSGTYDMANRKLYVDGVEQATAAMTAATGAKTNNLYIGSRVTTSATASLMGDIAEILVYSEVPTEKERLELSAYFKSKYGVGSVLLPSPVSSVPTGTYASPQAVTLSLPSDVDGALIYYTLNDSAPLSEWSLYTAPVTVSSTAKLRAVAVKSGFDNSLVTERSIAISSATNYVSRSNLALWFKADEGVSKTGALVDSWTDQSGAGVRVLGTTTTRPTWTQTTFSAVPPSGASRDVVRFTTTSVRTYLESPDLTPAAPAVTLDKVTVFAVANRTGGTGTAAVIVEQLTPNTSGFSLQSTGASTRALRINSAVTTHTSPNAATAFELIEGAYNKAQRTLRIDGGTDAAHVTQTAQTGNLGNPARNLYIGGRVTAANTNLDGDIAEILVYNKEFTSSNADQDEYRGIMAYLHDKYGVAYKPVARAPSIDLPKNIFTTAQTVTLTNNEPGSTLYYTVNNTAPTTSSTVYTAPIAVSGTVKIRAIAVKDRFLTSPEMSYDVIIDPTAVYVAESGLNVWLRADAGVTVEGGQTAQWRDQSGHSFIAAQSTSVQRPGSPSSSSAVINNRPKIFFNSSSGSGATKGQYLVLPDNAALNSTAVSIFAVGLDTYDGSQTRLNIVSKGTVTSNGYGLSYNKEDAGVSLRTNSTHLSGTISISEPTFSMAGTRNSLTSGKNLFYNGKSLAQQSGTSITAATGNMYIGWGGETTGTSPAVPTNLMKGEIAEIFVYDRYITDDERRNLEAYAYMRYGIACQPEARAPEFAVANASGGWGGKVVSMINNEPGSVVHFTTDGSEPSEGSPLYTTGITLSRGTTIKAAAFKMGFARSPLTIQTWQLNPQWTLTEVGSEPLVEQAYTPPTTNWSIATQGGGFGSTGDKLSFASLQGVQGSGMDWTSSTPTSGLRGIMARASTQKDSAFVFLGFNSSGQCRFITRPVTGSTTAPVDRLLTGVTSGSQLRLKLVGNSIFAFTKTGSGDWVRGPGSDLYDPQGAELGRGLKNVSGQAVDTYRIGMCFTSATQGVTASHSIADTSVAYQVEQQTVRWHRLIEPKISSTNYAWSRNGYTGSVPESPWSSPTPRSGMAGGDFIKGDFDSSQTNSYLSFDNIQLGTAKSIDLYVRLASTTGTALPVNVSTWGGRNSNSTLTITPSQAEDAWHYVGALSARASSTSAEQDEIDLTLFPGGAGAGYLTVDGFMMVARDTDDDFNQNGIADDATEDDYLLSMHGDYNGDGWSNYLSYLMTGHPLQMDIWNTPSRNVTISRAPGQADKVAGVAGQWLPQPLQYRVTYTGGTDPVAGCEVTVKIGSVLPSYTDPVLYVPYYRGFAGIAGSPDHRPQVQPLKLVTDADGIAKVWVYKPLSEPRSTTYIYGHARSETVAAPLVSVYTYPNALPGDISVDPEEQDLRRVLTQPWSHEDPIPGAFKVRGDLMAAGLSGADYVRFYRWNKETGKWQTAESLLPPAAHEGADGFGKSLEFVEDGTDLQLVVESLSGYFIYDVEVDATSVAADFDSFLETESGQTLVIHGNVIALGQPGSGDSGQVRLYKKVSGVWTLQQTLTPSTAAPADHFGKSVSLSADGQRLAVGAPGDSEWHLAAPAGTTPADPAVYVYVWNPTGATWDLEQKLELETPVNAAFGFGERVAFLSNDALLVGSPYAETAESTASQAGRMEAFKLGSGSVWDRVAAQDGDAPSYGMDFVVEDGNIFVNVSAALGTVSGSPVFEEAHLAHVLWDSGAESLEEVKLLRFPQGGVVQLEADGSSLFAVHAGFVEQYEMLPRVAFDAPEDTVVATLTFNDPDLDWPWGGGNLLQTTSSPSSLSVVESIDAALDSIVPPPHLSPWNLETPVSNPKKSRQLVVQSSEYLEELRGEVSWLNFRITDHAGETDFETVGVSVTDSLPATPASLQARAGGNHLIRLYWNPPAVAPLGYVLERAPLDDYETAVSTSADLNTVFRKIAHPQRQDIAYDDSVSTVDAGYAYRLKSWNGTGYSSYTSPVVLDLFNVVPHWPTWWEIMYGGGLLPGDDSDGDGWTNLQEFENGTNPGLADTDGDGERDSDDEDPLNASRVSVRNVLHTRLAP